ncbi:MAG: HAD family hydrolase [Propionibacteriaceae bacterium]|jgi:phosphoglycolate phosphatase-like HAD superfamily hydrolase|nr:HAD family hydrolase [Propionibacteriaceae bacterium]
MIDTILFDCDGTLIDTEDAIIESFQLTLRDELGLDEPAAALDFILGIPGIAATRRYTDSEEAAHHLLEVWTNNTAAGFRQTSLFPGIADLLDWLKSQGYRTAIVTSRLAHELVDDIPRLSLDRWFDTFVTASDTERHKPDAQPTELALQRLGASPGQSLFIGDSIYDQGSANAAGVLFGLAGWGVRHASHFDQAALIAQTPADVAVFLQQR